MVDWNESNSLPKSIQNPAVFSHTKNYIAQEKLKTFKETVSFHLASNHLKFLNQMYFGIFYIFTL